MRPVKVVKDPLADLVLLQYHSHGLGLIVRRIAGAAALGVSDERLLELIGEAEVIQHQAPGLSRNTPLEQRFESRLGQWLGCAHGKTGEGESTDGDLAVHQHRKEPVAEFGEFFVLFVAVFHLRKEWGSLSCVGLHH